MDAKFLTRTLGGLTAGASSLLLVFACSSGDESLGSDSTAAQHGKGGSSSNTEPNCEMIECLRAVECVETCGGPVIQASCCPCPDGLLDELVECPSGGEGGASPGGGSGGTVSMGGYSAAGTPGNGEGGHAQAGGGGEPGTVEPDLSQLHAACDGGSCPPGLTPLSYYGFAGP